MDKKTTTDGNFIAAAAKSSNVITNLAKGICFFGGFGVQSNMGNAITIFTKYTDDVGANRPRHYFRYRLPKV